MSKDPSSRTSQRPLASQRPQSSHFPSSSHMPPPTQSPFVSHHSQSKPFDDEEVEPVYSYKENTDVSEFDMRKSCSNQGLQRTHRDRLMSSHSSQSSRQESPLSDHVSKSSVHESPRHGHVVQYFGQATPTYDHVPGPSHLNSPRRFSEVSPRHSHTRECSGHISPSCGHVSQNHVTPTLGHVSRSSGHLLSLLDDRVVHVSGHESPSVGPSRIPRHRYLSQVDLRSTNNDARNLRSGPDQGLSDRLSQVATASATGLRPSTPTGRRQVTPLEFRPITPTEIQPLANRHRRTTSTGLRPITPTGSGPLAVIDSQVIDTTTKQTGSPSVRPATPTKLRPTTPTKLRPSTLTKLRSTTPTKLRPTTPTELRPPTPTGLRSSKSMGLRPPTTPSIQSSISLGPQSKTSPGLRTSSSVELRSFTPTGPRPRTPKLTPPCPEVTPLRSCLSKKFNQLLNNPVEENTSAPNQPSGQRVLLSARTDYSSSPLPVESTQHHRCETDSSRGHHSDDHYLSPPDLNNVCGFTYKDQHSVLLSDRRREPGSSHRHLSQLDTTQLRSPRTSHSHQLRSPLESADRQSRRKSPQMEDDEIPEYDDDDEDETLTRAPARESCRPYVGPNRRSKSVNDIYSYYVSDDDITESRGSRSSTLSLPMTDEVYDLMKYDDMEVTGKTKFKLDLGFIEECPPADEDSELGVCGNYRLDGSHRDTKGRRPLVDILTPSETHNRHHHHPHHRHRSRSRSGSRSVQSSPKNKPARSSNSASTLATVAGSYAAAGMVPSTDNDPTDGSIYNRLTGWLSSFFIDNRNLDARLTRRSRIVNASTSISSNESRYNSSSIYNSAHSHNSFERNNPKLKHNSSHNYKSVHHNIPDTSSPPSRNNPNRATGSAESTTSSNLSSEISQNSSDTRNLTFASGSLDSFQPTNLAGSGILKQAKSSPTCVPRATSGDILPKSSLIATKTSASQQFDHQGAKVDTLFTEKLTPLFEKASGSYPSPEAISQLKQLLCDLPLENSFVVEWLFTSGIINDVCGILNFFRSYHNS